MHAFLGLDAATLSALTWWLGVACSVVLTFCPAASVVYKLATIVVPLLNTSSAIAAPQPRLVGSGSSPQAMAQALRSSSSALTVARPAPVVPVVVQAVPSGPTVAQQAPPDDIFQGGGG